MDGAMDDDDGDEEEQPWNSVCFTSMLAVSHVCLEFFRCFDFAPSKPKTINFLPSFYMHIYIHEPSTNESIDASCCAIFVFMILPFPVFTTFYSG